MDLSIALLQLPVPDPDPLVAQANVPLAAGYLKAFALKKNRLGPESIRILPRRLANFGGDQAILDWVIGHRFSLVGFTCYLWNLERNLWLAHRIKEASPRTRIVFGGPEIVEGQPVLGLHEPAADCFVLGEGEPGFLNLATNLLEARPPQKIYRSPLADLADIPNPYLAGALPAWSDEPLHLETQRGCPDRCSYCFYGKQFPTQRYFPAENLPAVFELARQKQVPEIYLMDPSFNASRNLAARLERIQKQNSTAIPLHTEIRLESVTPDIARLMGQAGFTSVEVGLQSTNRAALRFIRRSWNRPAFLRGAEALRRQGIAVRTGIILGLPGDSLESFGRTLEFLSAHGLAQGAEIYPLSLLPGTELRETAAQMSIDFMPLPPYWVLRSELMSEPDLFQAIRLVEERLEAEFFPPVLPHFEDPTEGTTGFLDLRSGGPAHDGLSGQASAWLGNNLTLLFSASQLENPQELAAMERLGARILEENPFCLVQLVIEGQDLPPLEPAQRLAEAFYNPRHYFNRARYYQQDLQGRFSTRTFHLTSSLSMARRYYEEPLPFDLLLRYSPELLRRGRDLLEQRPVLLADRRISPLEERELRSMYQSFEKLIIFAEAFPQRS